MKTSTGLYPLSSMIYLKASRYISAVSLSYDAVSPWKKNYFKPLLKTVKPCWFENLVIPVLSVILVAIFWCLLLHLICWTSGIISRLSWGDDTAQGDAFLFAVTNLQCQDRCRHDEVLMSHYRYIFGTSKETYCYGSPGHHLILLYVAYVTFVDNITVTYCNKDISFPKDIQ